MSGNNLSRIAIVGTGFVADLYMRSLETFPDLKVVKAYDIDKTRLAAFCSHWGVSPAENLGDLFDEGSGSAALI